MSKHKNKIRPVYRGPLKNFQKWVKIHRLNGRQFHTIKGGATAYIIDKHYIDVFIDRDESRNMAIPTLCRQVTMDIRKYELTHARPKPKATYPIVEVNKGVVEQMKVDDCFIAVDMVACYWNFAYKLGYIRKSTYERGLKDKESRLIAIGNLNKTSCRTDYGKGYGRGVKIYQKCEYADYWHSILNAVEKLYYSMVKVVGRNNYIAFETDCIFIKESAFKDLSEYLKDINVQFTDCVSYVTSYTGTEFNFTMIDSFLGTDKILHCR